MLVEPGRSEPPRKCRLTLRFPAQPKTELGQEVNRLVANAYRAISLVEAPKLREALRQGFFRRENEIRRLNLDLFPLLQEARLLLHDTKIVAGFLASRPPFLSYLDSFAPKIGASQALPLIDTAFCSASPALKAQAMALTLQAISCLEQYSPLSFAKLKHFVTKIFLLHERAKPCTTTPLTEETLPFLGFINLDWLEGAINLQLPIFDLQDEAQALAIYPAVLSPVMAHEIDHVYFDFFAAPFFRFGLMTYPMTQGEADAITQALPENIPSGPPSARALPSLLFAEISARVASRKVVNALLLKSNLPPLTLVDYSLDETQDLAELLEVCRQHLVLSQLGQQYFGGLERQAAVVLAGD